MRGDSLISRTPLSLSCAIIAADLMGRLGVEQANLLEGAYMDLLEGS